MRSWRGRWLLVVLALWALAPVLMLALRSVHPIWRYPQLLPGALDAWTAVDTGARERLTSALGTSAALALAAGPASTVLGFAIARTATRARVGLRRLTLGIALFMVVAPPVALGVGLQVALLSLGLGGTTLGVWLAHLVPATGYLTLFASGVLTGVDRSLEDEARTLGASQVQVWRRILIPLLRPRLAEGAVLGALVSWGQLAVTLLIGGGIVRTLPVELLSLVQSGNDQLGAAMALLLSVPPMCAIGLLTAGTERSGAAV